jgi:triphosphatase
LDGNLEPFRLDAFVAKLDPDVSAARALQAITRSCVGQIRAHEPDLLQTRAPEALHQLRIALRRWRTALTVFHDVIPDEGAELAEDLRWLARELNEARDLDVFAEGLADAAARDPAAAADLASIKGVLDRMRAQAHQRVAQALTSDRARRLQWEGARSADAAASVLGADGPSARKLAARALSRRRRQIRRRGPDLKRLSAEERHELRISAKKARYAAELLGELFGRPGLQRRTVRALKAVQDALGALNDIHVGRQIAARVAREAGTAEAGFAAGMLAGARAAGDETRLLKTAARAYDRFAALDSFW